MDLAGQDPGPRKPQYGRRDGARGAAGRTGERT